MADPASRPAERTGRFAFLVASGILLSRALGFVRGRALAHFFGTSDVADAFAAAFKIPNFLQYLFGEGVLSASFIPAYSRLLSEGRKEEADRLASAVLTLLALVTSCLVAAGIALTPVLMPVIAPGFAGEKRDLTILLVRILFPGVGILVLSAWCLGVLNSHRRFFVSYTAPVAWNLAIIVLLVMRGGRVEESRLAVLAAWASVVGCVLQAAVQLPTVLGLLGHLRLTLGAGSEHVRTVVRSFLPVFAGRGVGQVSAYVDVCLASLTPTGGVQVLSLAQNLYMLPVSLFGMAISAAELPAMSATLGSAEEVASALRTRLDAGLRRMAFFIVPSAVAFLALGDLLAGALFQSGRFTRHDAEWTWGVLAGSAIGLLASTLGRLYSSAYYALRDTRTPLAFAVMRVALTTGLGYVFALPLPRALGLDPRWGVAGLTASAGLAGWLEFLLLRRTLNRRIGPTGLPLAYLARLYAGAGVAAGLAWAARWLLPADRPLLVLLPVVGTYGLAYFGLTSLLRVDEAATVVRRVLGAARGA